MAGKRWREDGDFVFTSRDGGRIMPEEPTQLLDAALEEAGLAHIRFHDLRHSTASLLLSKSVPMKVVQEIMGHSSFQITAETYSHLVANELQEAMQAMDDLFAKPTAGNNLPARGSIQ